MARRSSPKQRRQRGDLLAPGDLLRWATKRGGILTWVVNVIPQSGGPVALLEVLDGIHAAAPVQLDQLRAWPAPAAQKHRIWYVVTDLRAATDDKGRYERLAREFAPVTFAPSRDSKHGLHAPWIDLAALRSALEELAHAQTPRARARAASAERLAEREAAARDRARRAVRDKAEARLAPVAEPRSMAKPREPGARRFVLSLTGRHSHVVWFAPGVGNMSVGPAAPSTSVTPHAMIGANERVFWDGLDAIPPTGGGSAMPRWLDYEGADIGLFAWLARRERPLERLTFRPTKAVRVDARRARIEELVIDSAHGVRIELVLREGVRTTILGDHTRVKLVDSRGKDIRARLERRPARSAARFSGWSISKRGLGVANAALSSLRRSLRGLATANTRTVKPHVLAFVDALNALHSVKDSPLLTAERDDAAAALDALFSAPPLAPFAERARAWFDARREF